MKTYKQSEIADLLKQRRALKQMTRFELAKRLKVNQQQIYAWESGIAPLPVKHAGKVCRFLDISPKALVKTLLDDYKQEIMKFVSINN